MRRIIAALALVLTIAPAVAQNGLPGGPGAQIPNSAGGSGSGGGITALTGDCTASGSGSVAATCLKTNGAPFGALATVAPGTGVAAAAANATNGAGGVPVLNGSGVLSAAQGGSGDAGAFTTFTPTFTLTGGTGTSATSLSGGFRQNGKELTFFVEGIISYTTIPTAITVTLPNSAVAAQAATVPIINASINTNAFSIIFVGQTAVTITGNGVTTPPLTASGQALILNGVVWTQ